MSSLFGWSVPTSPSTRTVSPFFYRKMLYAAIGLTLSTNALAGFPTLYGQVQISAGPSDFEKVNFPQVAPATNPVTYRHVGGKDVTTELDSFGVESAGSRLGVQGDFDAATVINIVYRVEYGVDFDNGTNSNGRELVQRNIFGGLRGDWGLLLAGKNDTPVKSLAGRQSEIIKDGYQPTVLRNDIDLFNEVPLADIGTYLVGENRADNSIQYSSPVLFDGLEITVAAIQGEETGIPQSASNQQNDNGFASGKSISLGYGKSGWFVGAAYESNVANTDLVRAVGDVTLGPVTLGAIYQTAERHADLDSLGGITASVNSTVATVGAQNGLNVLSEWDGVSGTSYKKQDGFVVNALWKIAGPWSTKIQYGDSTSTPTNALYKTVDVNALALGVDYALNDATRLFSFYATVKAEGDALISTESTTDKLVAVGLDFRF